jgi:hypothetical protein
LADSQDETVEVVAATGLSVTGQKQPDSVHGGV